MGYNCLAGLNRSECDGLSRGMLKGHNGGHVSMSCHLPVVLSNVPG